MDKIAVNLGRKEKWSPRPFDTEAGAGTETKLGAAQYVRGMTALITSKDGASVTDAIVEKRKHRGISGGLGDDAK